MRRCGQLFGCIQSASLALVLALVVVGWLSFGRSNGEPAVILETNQIQQDTEKAAEKGKELLHEATQKVEDLRKDRGPNEDAGSNASSSSDEPQPDDIPRSAQPVEPQ